MIVETIAFGITGIIIGGIIVWLILRIRYREDCANKIAELHMGYANQLAPLEAKAMSAEAVVGELRQQILQKDTHLDQIRNVLDSEKQGKIEALTKLDEARKGFEEQKALIDTMKKEMTDTFNALSSAALKSSSEDFLRLASESLGKVVTDTKGRLGEHQVAMDGMIKPLYESLKRYEEQIKTMEEGRHKAYGSLGRAAQDPGLYPGKSAEGDEQPGLCTQKAAGARQMG